MPTITPATILYTPEGSSIEQKLNFDAVLAEDHKTTAKITKFPVQEGFHVTNHSIRNNRVVSITGMISNMKFDLGPEKLKTNYGSNATAHVKQIMDALIQKGTECRVVTNLGNYFPVVFNAFKTVQKSGMVDSMQFTITGEEIVKANAVSFTAPTPIIFTELSGADKDVVRKELSEKHVYVKRSARILRGAYKVGQDFSIQDVNAAGIQVTTHYIFIGIDPSTGAQRYQTHISEEAVAITSSDTPTAAEDACAEAGFIKSKVGGITQVGDCLLNSATSIAVDIVEELVDTAVGKLVRSARGFLYDTVEFAGGQDSAGGLLLTAGVSCVVRGATGNTDPGNYNPGESLPTTAQILEGAALGLGFTEPKPEIITLYQIRCNLQGQGAPDVDAFQLPL